MFAAFSFLIANFVLSYGNTMEQTCFLRFDTFKSELFHYNTDGIAVI